VAYVASGPPLGGRALLAITAGGIVNIGALFGAFILFLLGGNCSGNDNGHVDDWMWAIGLAVLLVVGAWALRRPWHAWWGLPAATLAAAVVVVALANVVTGSTGACID
jgi:hypothetical protein